MAIQNRTARTRSITLAWEKSINSPADFRAHEKRPAWGSQASRRQFPALGAGLVQVSKNRSPAELHQRRGRPFLPWRAPLAGLVSVIQRRAKSTVYRSQDGESKTFGIDVVIATGDLPNYAGSHVPTVLGQVAVRSLFPSAVPPRRAGAGPASRPGDGRRTDQCSHSVAVLPGSRSLTRSLQGAGQGGAAGGGLCRSPLLGRVALAGQSLAESAQRPANDPWGPARAAGDWQVAQVYKRRGTYPPAAGRPWMAWEDAAVRELSPAEAAKKTGRTRSAINSRRFVLQVPDGRRRRQRRRFDR